MDATYMRCSIVAPHKEGREMINKIAELFEALYAPLARELARMPPSALRSLVTPGA
jgi:hypothetical protein